MMTKIMNWVGTQEMKSQTSKEEQLSGRRNDCFSACLPPVLMETLP